MFLRFRILSAFLIAAKATLELTDPSIRRLPGDKSAQWRDAAADADGKDKTGVEPVEETTQSTGIMAIICY